MKKNRRRLLAVQLCSALGNAVVGIFFPFLFARAFGLSTAEMIAWMAGVHLGLGLLMFPVNRLVHRFFPMQRVLQIGLGLQSLFLILLALAPTHPVWMVVTAGLLVLHIAVFWPSWHVALLHSSRDGVRGEFTGHIQVMMVGANLIAPLLAGWMLDRGLDAGVLALSVVMFVAAIVGMARVELPKQKLSKFSTQWQVFRDKLWRTRHRTGVLTDGFQSGVLWILWPVFLGAALGNFTQMGIVVAVAAAAEILSAKIFGHLTDKKSARKILDLGQWLRAVDLGVRGLLMWFPAMWVAAMVSINAGVLGPVFNISTYGRMCAIAEKNSPRELEWFIAREWTLAPVRVLVFVMAAVAVHFFGEMILGWALIVAGIASFGFRRY